VTSVQSSRAARPESLLVPFGFGCRLPCMSVRATLPMSSCTAPDVRGPSGSFSEVVARFCAMRHRARDVGPDGG
jgi:hypothetical protein